MKNYSLYFLSLILTLGFWATPGFAQSFNLQDALIAQNEASTAHRENKAQIIVEKYDVLTFSAKEARRVGNLATYVEIYDDNGEFLCATEDPEVHPQYENVTIFKCGEYAVSAYLNTDAFPIKGFVYSVFKNNTNKPFAKATLNWLRIENEAARSFVEVWEQNPVISGQKN